MKNPSERKSTCMLTAIAEFMRGIQFGTIAFQTVRPNPINRLAYLTDKEALCS